VTDPSLWTRVGISLLQVAALALGGPLLLGMMGKIRARVEGRVGPPVTQGLADLMKLLRKEAIRSEHMSALGAMAPLVLAGSAGMAAAITPLLTTHPVDSGGADVFVVVYLLLMGSVAIALGGLEVEVAADGRIVRAKIVDPSFLNWPALSIALADTIIPDFPLANKSFNLSYAGNDL
jgi:formate hydrogenlyase subunit 4